MDPTEGQTADTAYGTSETAVGPPTEAQATGIAESFATEFSGYDTGLGAPPAATGASTAKEAGVPANSTGAKATDTDGWSGVAAKVETSVSETINTVLNTLLSILGLASGPVGAIRGAQSLYNMANSGAYGRLGSAPGVTSTGRGASAAQSSFFSGGPVGGSDRGDSISSPVIGWGGTMVNAPAAATVKPGYVPFSPASKPVGPPRFAGPPIAAASSGGDTGGGGSIGAVVAVGAVLFLLA